MTLPRSNRRTMPVMTSPLRSLYSLKTFSRSALRVPWMITCFAVCAAMRPKLRRKVLSLRRSPHCSSCALASASSSAR